MLLSEQTLKRLDAFSLAMRESARGGAGGMRRAKALGSSVEFSDFRSYSPGDDLRRIDWNAYARFDKLFLKLFLDEQETTLRVLLDASRSMRFGEPDKWRTAQTLAAMLSYLALSRYDRVMLVVLQDGRVRHSEVFGSRSAYGAVEAYLLAIEPDGATQLDSALAQAPSGAGRSICVLISDLLSQTGWSMGARSLLHRRQELSVLHLLSPQELSPEYTGALRLLDSEGGPSCEVNISPETLRRYGETLDAFLLEQRQFCFARAIPYLLLRSDMDLEKDVLRALALQGIIAAR